MWQPTVSYGELYHHGILGQKWGIRRYQNPDGSLTSAGRKRYGANTVEEIKSAKGITRRLNDLDQAQAFNKRAYSEARSKNVQLENKKEKMMESRRPNQKKLRKMNNETIKTASEMRKAESYLKKGDKEKEALIKAAEIMGYNIKSKEVNRSVVRGKDVMKHVGLGVLSKTLSVVTGSPITLYTLPANRAPGTKYKVKEAKYKYDYDPTSGDMGVSRADGKRMTKQEADKQAAILRKTKAYEDMEKNRKKHGLGGQSWGPQDKEVAKVLRTRKETSTEKTKKPSSFATIHGTPIYINKKLNEQQVRNMANNLKSQRNWTEEEKEKYIRAHGFSV